MKKTSVLLISILSVCAAGIAAIRATQPQQPVILEPVATQGVVLAPRVHQPAATQSALLVASTSALISSESAYLSPGGPAPESSSSAQNTPPPTPTTSPAAPKVATDRVAVAQPSPTPSSWDTAFETYGAAYGVDPQVLKKIAKCESGYNQAAVNGPHGGMYQYLASTWSSTRTAMGEDPNPDLRFNGEEAIKTTAWKIAHGGIGAWPHCGKM